jgi:hypothetical protein
MSHFTRMRTTLRDPNVLAAALKETGYANVEVHDRPHAVRGWGSARSHAEVIIRREHITTGSTGDIGFVRGQDGAFQVVMDDMDRHRLGPGWLPRLTQAYGHAAALKYAEDHGYEVVTDEVERDGTRRLTLRRSS